MHGAQEVVDLCVGDVDLEDPLRVRFAFEQETGHLLPDWILFFKLLPLYCDTASR